MVLGNRLVNDSSPPIMLATSAHLCDRPAGPAHQDGLPSFHFHSQGGYIHVPAAGACTMTQIPIVQEFLSPPLNSNHCDFTQWPFMQPWRNGNGLVQLWDPNLNNFDRIPSAALRQTPVYQTAHFNFEPLPRLTTIMQRIGATRYAVQIHNTCVNDYLMLDGGVSYFERLHDSFCLSPGNHVSINQILTRPQFCDKVLSAGPSRIGNGLGHPHVYYKNSRHLVPLASRENDLRSRMTANANNFRATPYAPSANSEIGMRNMIPF